MDQKRTAPNGLLVMFEGLDGVGKTTQLKLAEEDLKQANWAVHTTRNLGGSPIGEELRKVILSPLKRPPSTDMYIGLAVQEALADSLTQERSQGKIILIDRGPISFAAYSSYGGDLDTETIWQYADDGIKKLQPNLILYYTLDIEKALSRVESRPEAKNYFENKPIAYFERVQEGLNIGAERYHAIRISADDTIENIHEKTMAEIYKLLG